MEAKNLPHGRTLTTTHFLIEDISVDKCAKNLNGFFLRSLPVCQKMVNFQGISRNFKMSTFWEMKSLEQFDQGGWFYFYVYRFLHRFQKYNNYYCVTCKFSWIKCQTCFHIQCKLQFFNIQSVTFQTSPLQEKVWQKWLSQALWQSHVLPQTLGWLVQHQKRYAYVEWNFQPPSFSITTKFLARQLETVFVVLYVKFLVF